MGILQKVTKAIRSSLSSDYGSFKRSREVERIFEGYQILADHTYYTVGPDADPIAIMGIHRDHTLRSRLWKKVDLTESQLKAWVDEMSNHIDFAPMPHGFFILDQTKRPIGVFYSPEQTNVRIQRGNEIIVGVPGESAKLEQG
jgi:hypothetical protein